MQTTGGSAQYHLDLSDFAGRVARKEFGPFDSEGVPLVDYDNLFRTSLPRSVPPRDVAYGTHYTPVTIAQYGLGSLDCYYATGEQCHLSRFFAQANWLLANLHSLDEGAAVWLHKFAFPHYHLKPPWVSGMAQGQGISLLLRARDLSHDSAYERAAQKAFHGLTRAIHRGGATATDAHGSHWIEEIPTDPPCHVLNGSIFGLWGVWDLLAVTGDPNVRVFWHKCLQTLRHSLPKYDIPFWSRYDLLVHPIASEAYHRLHIAQLQVLEHLTNDPIFSFYARRWQNGMRPRYRAIRFLWRAAHAFMRKLRLRSTSSFTGVSTIL